MLMKCSQCAAPLDVAPGSEFARCGYCGTSVQLRAQAQRVAPAPTAARTQVLPLVAGFVMMLVIAGSVTAYLAARPAVRSAPVASSARLPGLPAIPKAPARSFHSPVCLLDANGDGVDDPLGMGGVAGSSRQASLVDGATGKLLWSGPAPTGTAQLACLDERWFVLAGDDFQAEFHDVRNLGAGVRVLLRDKLREVGMGKGCARLRTMDGSFQGVQLPGGAAAECRAATRGIYEEPPGMIGLTGKATRLVQGKRLYKLEKRRNGTPMLIVTVEEGEKKLWSRELPYTAATFSSAIAAGGQSIALWGAKPGDQSHGVLIGLDQATGEQRYAVPSELQVSNNLGFFAFNGRYVVMQAWSSLHAYDPDTGKLAWKVGP